MAIAIQLFMFKVLDFWDGPGLRLFAALFIFVDAKKTSNFRDYILYLYLPPPSQLTWMGIHTRRRSFKSCISLACATCSVCGFILE